MKHVKRFSTLLAALVMMLAMTSSAFAYTITLTPNSDDKGTHTYEAYQVFTGDLYEKSEDEKILSNIVWGSGVDGAALLAELKTTKFGEATPFAACTNAAEVADVLEKFDNDAENTQLFADIAAKHLATPAGTGSDKIEGLTEGYYLVKDKDGSQDGQEDAAYTRFILEVVSDVTATVKSEVPSVDKKITGGEKKLSATSASIGDKVPYEITSKVPDMTGYNKYFFVLNDTMDKGLTFNDDVAITIGTKTLAEDTDFTVETGKDGDKTTVKIVLKNFLQYNDQKGADISVTYSATLNEKADLSATGNANEVKLTYSNNPNYDYEGKPDNPDEPGPDEPKGETPEVQTKTFTTGIELIKVDSADETKTLTGAKFTIEGKGVVVTLVNKEIYKKDAEGTYYMLKDGTYTTTAPTDDTKDKYDDEGKQKYAKVTEVVEETKNEPVSAEGYVDESGHLKFEGLNAGTYTITEVVAPKGYNLLKDPVTVEIKAELDDKEKTCEWSAKMGEEDLSANDNNLFEVQIKNKSGATLPSTGGIGTRIFYGLGTVLVLGAGIVLISRKRAGKK